MWVLFDIVYFNVSHLSWFLDLALVVTLWPTLVMGEVAVGVMFFCVDTRPFVVTMFRQDCCIHDGMLWHQSLEACHA